ncbi:hypothetical protein SERLADRAFT_479062, partial [Serpula lacrymans var. lacrymans S7.9]
MQPIEGITVHDSEVLEPDPVRRGGLMQKDIKHTFRQPAKPIEPPTPRGSLLGLDRLAKEKREAAALDSNGSRKRPRIDGQGDPVFKVPNLPISRNNNIRQRGEETPSHPGGLSDAARKKLEDYRKNREKQREGIAAPSQNRADATRGLGDFQRRLNRDRDRGWSGKRDFDGERDKQYGRNWDLTPRSEAPSVRVPNVGWDSTPRHGRSEDGVGWGGARNRA